MDRDDFYTMAWLLTLNVCTKTWKDWASFVHIFVLIWILKGLCSSFKDSRSVLVLVMQQEVE